MSGPNLILPGGGAPAEDRASDLILPKHLAKFREQRQGQRPDKSDLALARQLLDLLQHGLAKNQWPSWVLDYRPFGIHDDLGLVYHLISFARARGYGVGLKAAEVAAGSARASFEKEAEKCGKDPEGRADPYGPEQRAQGAAEALSRIRTILDAAQPPGV